MLAPLAHIELAVLIMAWCCYYHKVRITDTPCHQIEGGIISRGLVFLLKIHNWRFLAVGGRAIASRGPKHFKIIAIGC